MEKEHFTAKGHHNFHKKSFSHRLNQRSKYWKFKALKERLRKEYLNELNVDERNFRKAAERLRGTFQYKGATSIYVSIHPYLEQVRFNALMDGKFLVVPDANFKKGFYILNPKNIKPRDRLAAVKSSSGVKKFGEKINPARKIPIPRIKLALSETLAACNECGAVLNDGNGFLDLALATLRLLGWLDESFTVGVFPVFKGPINCGNIVMKENDWWADIIVLPEGVIYPSKPQVKFPLLIREILDKKRIKRSDVLFYIFNRLNRLNR